jgi:hypothetical protein
MSADAPTVMDAWSTTVRTFTSGTELLATEHADDLAELHASFQGSDGNGDAADMLGVDMDTFVERLKVWPEDAEFCAQDLALHTHTNAATGDKLFYWNYGLGDNDCGTFHFLLAGKPRSLAVHVMTNSDGDISFLGPHYDKFQDLDAWPKPGADNAHEAWAHEVAGLIDFYQRVEKQDDFDEETYEGVFNTKSTPVDLARFPAEDTEEVMNRIT